MYGDFSRFDGLSDQDYDHDGVWFQQGRLQLDADHNAQAATMRAWLRTLTQDLIGPFGGQGDRAGFEVSLDADGDLVFTPGHYYVFGARCVLRPSVDRRPITLRLLRRARSVALPKPPFLVHLQVWDETVGAVADPRLLEPALGPNPPDTTVRTRTAWRPQLDRDAAWVGAPPERDGAPLSGREWVNEVYEHWSSPQDRPRLRARVADAGRREASVISATAGYRGVENQLYRVEIHRPSGRTPGGQTFKWSRDNGSVVFGIESAAGGADADEGPSTVLTVNSLGRDARSTLAPGDWVELIDRSWAPFGEPGSLLAVLRVDPVTREVTVRGDVRVDTAAQAPRPFLRRWDQPRDSGDSDGVPITARPGGDAADEGWIELEDGIHVQFPLANARYQRGDFWLIPARTATGSVLWPGPADDPVALEPWGPRRRYAPLALVTDQGVTDLRTLFVPLAFPDVDAALPALAAPGAAPTPVPPAGAGTAGPVFPPVPADDLGHQPDVRPGDDDHD